ncbi:uncharacterized protein LTR77_007009 [Saxophila tyrrhenica]|uniref:Uncharacterized protein n=1 Tax=Saxophila tyrrhenica TaxID=1690608 RepID=A0AAV9P6U9_9PEZI|nr:hypothetical protein LTR77_007009 [Saxophila tyrrhenica]
MSVPTIYILYNAKASVLGKLGYAYRKINTSADCDSACAACDLTHGGLRLNESTQWKEAKARINANIEQLHQDEVTDELKAFMSRDSLRYPVVLARANEGPLKLLLDSQALNTVSKDHEAFLKSLLSSAEQNDIPLQLTEGSAQPSSL